MQQERLNNRLLAGLAPEEFDILAPHLRPRRVDRGDMLIEPGRTIAEVYFPEDGLASFVSPTAAQTEIGIVGREGMVGACILLGVERSPLKATGQIPGRGLGVPSAALLGLFDSRPAVRRLFLRYVHAFMIQCASTCYANAHLTVEQRLARWLLMTHDRLGADELALTHEFLAIMLGVRRPGVTVATHMLEGVHAIRARRGRITILDREKLGKLAGESYGRAEAEYEAMIAPPGQPRRAKAAAAEMRV